MDLSPRERAVLDAAARGLPLVARPYAAIAAAAGLEEAEVIAILDRLQAGGVIKRLGIVVRHRAVGYTANAMVVWDVSDARVDDLARSFAADPAVTLCYRRPRRPPVWPYNLFCMVHGRERGAVEAEVARLADACGAADVPHALLFSRRCFRQRGARYGAEDAA